MKKARASQSLDFWLKMFSICNFITAILILAPGYRVLNMTQISLISLLQIQPEIFEDLLNMFGSNRWIWVISFIPWLKILFILLWSLLMLLIGLSFAKAVSRLKGVMAGILGLQGVLAGLFLVFFLAIKVFFHTLSSTPAAQNDPLLFSGLQKIILSLSGWGQWYLLMCFFSFAAGIGVMWKKSE